MFAPLSPKQHSLTRQLLGLAGWVAVTLACAVLAVIASADAGTFYQQLTVPSWGPRASLFPPMWSTLYTLMALSAWLVWRERGFPRARPALTLFLVQLAANALWSWLYFVGRMGAVSFVEIIVLWLLIAATIVAFWRIHRLAAVLLIPYLAWITLACALTYTTWQRNPALLG